jgi:hypothetical protein
MIHLPQEDLAKFWLQAKYECTIFNKHPFIFLATFLKHVLEIRELFLQILVKCLAIGNLKKNFGFRTFSNLI